MDYKITSIQSGTITSPKGFFAGAVKAGIKTPDKLDLTILYSEKICKATGLFTTNMVKSAPVIYSQKLLLKKRAQALVVNSGCANACTGEDGFRDAAEMSKMVAEKLAILNENVLVASTGVIGVTLPMEIIGGGISKLEITKAGGGDFAKAIMTTDTFAKEIAFSVESELGSFIIAGVAKGAGMIHPNMATMLCFITTDANIESGFLRAVLKRSVDVSFNMTTVDGDTSPSDSVILMANGLADNKTINKENGDGFQAVLNEICIYLAKSIARDGEGATKLIEVQVKGAGRQSEAKIAARTIANSPLVKTAIHGNDPNWGRIVAALGRCGVKLNDNSIDVFLEDVCVMRDGRPTVFDKNSLSAKLAGSKEVIIVVDLNMGLEEATAWGCDLSEEYVTINSAYTT
jgi:glutamate N-acetyltransferase/amino-acid N-acetyltransferase